VRVPVGDIDLYVRDRGLGRPLVLLHGGPGLDGSVFGDALDPLLDDGVRLVAVDERGNGRSDAGDPSTWTVDRMADDVQALIEAMGLDRPVVLGWSFGSFIAQAHMARHGTAAGYVFMATVAAPEALELIAGELERFEPEHLREQVAASWEREATVQTQEECTQLLLEQIPYHVADPEGPIVAELARIWGSVIGQPAVLRHFAAGGTYGLVDRRERLREVPVPVLVLSGEKDRTTSPASAHELAVAIGADEVVVARAAHCMLFEDREATLAALRAFLARVWATPP
jgi:proline iminopeptidase